MPSLGAGTLPAPAMIAEIDPTDESSPWELVLTGDSITFSGPVPGEPESGRWQAWTLRGVEATGIGGACPGSGAALSNYVQLPGASVAFISEDCWFSGTFLGKFDTVTGEFQSIVSSQHPTPSHVADLVRFGNQAYFSTSEGAIWSTDGTNAGTAIVPGVEAGSGRMTPVGDWAILGSYGRPWRYDGTASGSFQLSTEVSPVALPAPWPSLEFPPVFVPIGERVLFYGHSTDEGLELWSTVGTVSGTARLTTFRPGNGYVSVGPIVNCRGVGFFGSTGATPGDDDNQPHLWRSDGTANGTYPIGRVTSDGWRGRTAFPIGCIDDSLVAYEVDDPAGKIVLTTIDDESPGVTRLLETGLNLDIGYPAFEYHGWLFFTLGFGEEEYGRELWATDGTPAGTFRTGEISPGNGDANPRSLVGLGDSVYFIATNPTFGDEIWRIVVDPTLVFRSGFERATLIDWNQSAP